MPIVIVAIVLSLAGCAAAPSPAQRAAFQDETRRIGETYRAALAADDELAGVVPTATNPDGQLHMRVAVDGRAWSALTPSQQRRILDKAVFHLRGALGAVRGVGLFVIDDVGRQHALFVVSPDEARRLR